MRDNFGGHLPGEGHARLRKNMRDADLSDGDNEALALAGRCTACIKTSSMTRTRQWMAGKGGQGNDRGSDGGTRRQDRPRHQDSPEDQKADPLQGAAAERRLHADGVRRASCWRNIFSKGREEATRIMLHVHHKGVGICGVYHLRGRRDQGDAGDGLLAPAWPSSAMHHGERVGTTVPSFSKSLETSLHRALEYANERSHEFATLEHLLAALIDDRDAAAVMRACNVDLDQLRTRVTDYLDTELGTLVHKGTSRSAADHRLPARDPSRRRARAVLGPRGGDRRQRARRHLRRAREPCRLLPAGAGDDALRRRPVHQPRHRQARRHVRAARRARRRRGAGRRRRARRTRSPARTRSTPIASTSTRRRATDASIR